MTENVSDLPQEPDLSQGTYPCRFCGEVFPFYAESISPAPGVLTMRIYANELGDHYEQKHADEFDDPEETE